MKILFIVPPNITYDAYTKPASNVKTVTQNNKFLGAVVTDMPLGPLSLSSYVKNKHSQSEFFMMDFNVILNRINNFNFKSFYEFFDEVISRDEWKTHYYDIIGISALFGPAYKSMLDLAQISKTLYPKAFVLGGGGF